MGIIMHGSISEDFLWLQPHKGNCKVVLERFHHFFHTVASNFWMKSIKFTHVICVKSVKLLVCRHDVDTHVFSLFLL